ncbi:restriction endonuclease subunit S [Vibrio vulnificus]|uniref:restriction endonuclease subunit S n=1 Tax=Vibrio vulnificus TaxID=672 RepID=UPI00307DB785
MTALSETKRYQAYPEYKESDVEWLDDIPKDWCTRRLKHMLESPMSYGANEAAERAVSTEPRYIRITDMNSDGTLKEDTFRSLPRDIASDYLLKDRDILLARSGATVGKSFIYRKEFGDCCFAGYLIKVSCDCARLNSDYAFWFFQSSSYWQYISGSQIQATIQNVSAEKYGEMYISLPEHVEEQTQIANFLDHEIAKIDTLIEKQQLLIKLLKEKRQAVISHAVTKGLNPQAPMKDSGVEWLGEVPEHWGVSRVGWLCDYLSYGFTNPMPATDCGPYMLTAADIEYGQINLSNARKTSVDAYKKLLSAKSKPEKGDVLITKDGTLGRVALFDSDEVICISQSIALLRVNKNQVLPEFFSLALLGSDYQSKMIFDAGGTTIKHIYISILAKMNFLLPNLEEQREIVRVTNDKLKKTDLLIQQANQASALLQERRTALISAAVTGKIDVRNWQAPTEKALEQTA